MSNYSKTAEAVSRLSPEQYRVTQQSGTERPGTGKYLNNKAPGIYVDIVSGEPLFASSDKYELGMRLAELYQTNRARLRQRTARHVAWHGPYRGPFVGRR